MNASETGEIRLLPVEDWTLPDAHEAEQPESIVVQEKPADEPHSPAQQAESIAVEDEASSGPHSPVQQSDAPLPFNIKLEKLLAAKLLALLPAAVAGAVVVAFYFALKEFATDGTWIHDFFYKRMFVQWVTLYVFVLGIAALGRCILVFRRERNAFKPLSNCRDMAQARLPEESNDRRNVVRRRLALIRSLVLRRGVGDAEQYLKSQAERDAAELDAHYSVISDVAQTLPMLGFFGTVLGLSIALGSTGVSDSAAFKSAIGTSFDTTLLALGCTLMMIMFQRPIRKRHKALLGKLDTFTAEYLAYVDDRTPNATPEPVDMAREAAETLGNELKAVCADVAEAARDGITESCAGAMAQVADEISGARRLVEDTQQMAQRLPEQLAEHFKAMATDAAAAARQEIAAATAVTTQAFRVEVAAAADKVLAQMAKEYEGFRQDIAAAAAKMANPANTIEERQTAALQGFAESLTQKLDQLQAAIAHIGHNDQAVGSGLSDMAGILNDELCAIRQLTGTIEKHNGRASELVATALRENFADLGNRLDHMTSRPRRISIIEDPLIEGDEQ
ncbi:MAG: MotA/TolQ/ExbB proton channel family protein [Planctomycetes bacterium]|nr:MotA/TolQ/ExbB proton channel family protein [Planctomycetota bacterium]